MTILVCTIDDYPTIARVMGCLQQQEGRERCELLVLCPNAATLNMPADVFEHFASGRVIEVGPVLRRGHSAAHGVRAATAPIVAFTEDHSFPEPGWILGHLKAHEGPYPAVSAMLLNQNPRSPISWADMLIGHGAITAPQKGGVVDRLGGHNISYKRDLLLQYFDHCLGDMLDTEPVHHEVWKRDGYQLYLSPDALVQHTNFESWSSWISSQYNHGQLYAAARCKLWTKSQRLRFLIVAPLSPVTRLLKLLHKTRVSGGEYRRVPGLALYIVFGITVSITGEIMGCFFGPGKAGLRLTPLEFHRHRHYVKRYHDKMGDYD